MKSLLPIYVVTLTVLLGIVAGAPVPASTSTPKGSGFFSRITRGRTPSGGNVPVPEMLAASTLQPTQVYGEQGPICIRIANGGAGQVGLIEALALAFIKYIGPPACQIAWYLGDTTESLEMLASGEVDFALTYNEAAEEQSMKNEYAIERVPAFTDHFVLVGPRANPADLKVEDDILAMFNKIVKTGNRDATVSSGEPATRFLSRFDKSATNIKESSLFSRIGQVPWALGYSKWYHQYPRFPRDALRAASLLGEYTLIDKGTWIANLQKVGSSLKPFKIGLDKENDLLLNPASLLYAGKRTSGEHHGVCQKFIKWVSSKGGQKVIQEFKVDGNMLFTLPIGPEAGGTGRSQ